MYKEENQHFKKEKRNSSTRFLLLLWLPLHRWPKCFLLGCSQVLGFGFQGACGLFGFGLQGFEAQDLTVLVALVQSFELVNEGGGAVSLEAFVSGIKRGIFNQPGCSDVQPLSASLMYFLTLFYWWLFPHQWASSPRLKNQRIGILVPKIKNTFKNIYKKILTLHVSNQQVALRLMVDPVLESATFLTRLWVTPHQVDLFAVLDGVFDKVTD